jgi:hypothetical protein
MEQEQRRHPRFKPSNLPAIIAINPLLQDKAIILNGTVVDMSYTGIKIRLTQPATQIPDCEVRIYITLPQSEIPICIHGHIKHLSDQIHCGLKFSERHAEADMDDMMFECVKKCTSSLNTLPL